MEAAVIEHLEMDLLNLSGNDNLSMHFYGWGRNDFSDTDYYNDDLEGAFLYGYLQYRSTEGNFKFTAGRQHVFSGITNENVDGVTFKAKFTGFSMSGFAGQPSSLDTESGRSGDSTFGGRISHSFGSRYEIGASYQEVTNNSNEEDRKAGLDLFLKLPTGNSIYGFGAYNLEISDMAEYSLEGRFGIEEVEFRPSAMRFNFVDYFDSKAKKVNVFRNIAAGNPDETLTALGGELIWNKNEELNFGFKIKNFDYDKRNDTSQLYSTLLNWKPNDATLSGLELGYMNGDNPEDRYLLSRLHMYRDNLFTRQKIFVSGDLMYVNYDTPIYGTDNSFFASLGFGSRFLDDDLVLKISGDYSIDPYYDDDFRSMVVIKYLLR